MLWEPDWNLNICIDFFFHITSWERRYTGRSMGTRLASEGLPFKGLSFRQRKKIGILQATSSNRKKHVNPTGLSGKASIHLTYTTEKHEPFYVDALLQLSSTFSCDNPLLMIHK